MLALDARAESATLDRCVKDLATEQAELLAREKRQRDWIESNEKEHNARMALVLLSQLRNQRERTSSLAQRCEAVGAVVERSAVKFRVDASVLEITVSPGAQVREGDVVALMLPVRRVLDALPSPRPGMTFTADVLTRRRGARGALGLARAVSLDEPRWPEMRSDEHLTESDHDLAGAIEGAFE